MCIVFDAALDAALHNSEVVVNQLCLSHSTSISNKLEINL